jgi:YD repeat-containing protein
MSAVEGRSRGLLVVVGAAVAFGAVVLSLRGTGTPDVKLPGPCEVLRALPAPPEGMPQMPAERIVHHYDAQGRARLEQHYWGTHASNSTRWAYDDAGNMVLEERFTPGPIHHTDVDGTQRVLDHHLSRLRWTYDAAGHMLTRELERDADGVVQHTTHFAYDTNGRKVSAHAEWEGKYASDSTFEYDAEGHVVAERSDGGAQAHKRYEHDEHGRVVREIDDFLADGTPDRTLERHYDEQGRVVLETLDERDIGIRETSFTYDDAGNVLTRRERAREGEGGLEVLDTYDYRCWSLQDGQPVDERPPPE